MVSSMMRNSGLAAVWSSGPAGHAVRIAAAVDFARAGDCRGNLRGDLGRGVAAPWHTPAPVADPAMYDEDDDDDAEEEEPFGDDEGFGEEEEFEDDEGFLEDEEEKEEGEDDEGEDDDDDF